MIVFMVNLDLECAINTQQKETEAFLLLLLFSIQVYHALVLDPCSDLLWTAQPERSSTSILWLTLKLNYICIWKNYRILHILEPIWPVCWVLCGFVMFLKLDVSCYSCNFIFMCSWQIFQMRKSENVLIHHHLWCVWSGSRHWLKVNL